MLEILQFHLQVMQTVTFSHRASQAIRDQFTGGIRGRFGYLLYQARFGLWLVVVAPSAPGFPPQAIARKRSTAVCHSDNRPYRLCSFFVVSRRYMLQIALPYVVHFGVLPSHLDYVSQQNEPAVIMSSQNKRNTNKWTYFSSAATSTRRFPMLGFRFGVILTRHCLLTMNRISEKSLVFTVDVRVEIFCLDLARSEVDFENLVSSRPAGK